MVLAGSQGRAAPAGVFVAPGALGLGLGITLGRHWLTAPLWPFLPALAAACLVVLLVASAYRAPAQAPWATPQPARKAAIILVLLAFSVAIRSLVGTVGCDGCPRGWLLLVAVPVAAFAGKLSGGFLADRFGFIDVAMAALLASGPLLAFAGGDIAMALPGLLIFQMTMPVTLAAALRALPAWPGLGFGILCLALVGGSLPAYLPGGWRPQGLSLLLLVLASSVALYVALHLLRLQPASRTAPAEHPSPSTLCRGTP
jgi:FSR family fosmidomycin resistance protein-like MFS transporter